MQSLALRGIYDTFEAIQKMRIAAENRLRAIIQNYDEDHRERQIAMEHVKKIDEFEKVIVKQAEEVLKDDLIYNEFLLKVNGINVKTSLRLLSLGLDIERELSDWNAYFGIVPIYWDCECEHGHKILLPADPFTTGATCIMPKKVDENEEVSEDIDGSITVITRPVMDRCGGKIVKAEPMPPRRMKGYFSFWNKRAKKTFYIVTEYWVKNPNKSFYGRIFKQERERLMNRPDAKDKYYKIMKKDGKEVKVASRRATLSARRKAFKIFLAHLYQAWRELLGMEYRMPYAFEYLNHKDFIDWKEALRIEETLRSKNSKKKKVA